MEKKSLMRKKTLKKNEKDTVEMKKNTKEIASTSVITECLKDTVNKLSSDNFSQFTNTELNKTAIIPNKIIQDEQNYQDANFSKGI